MAETTTNKTMTLDPSVLTKGPLSQTRSKLRAARILKVDNNGHPLSNSTDHVVHCMFNPYEYTVTKSNSFDEQKVTQNGDAPKVELTKAGAPTLRLRLTFDGFEEEQDITLTTNKLWKFMAVERDEPKPNELDKNPVPLVAFHWGVFYFVSYITQMTQKFTLFTKDGVPVRADVDVTFTQYVDINDYPKQNPTSGDGPINRIWRVTAGDRLDLIAAEIYQDATQWRRIADYNQITDPYRLLPGQSLVIPFE